MKKCIAILLTIVLMIGILPAGISRSDAAITFKDVPSNSWYYSHIQFIVNYKYELMVGYAGNFGPLDNLTVEQFIKIAVAAAGKGVVVPKGQYWGDVYVPIGLDLGFVLPGEFTDYKRPITRAEMARIIIRALPSMTGEKDVTYNVNDIKSRMTDYDSIPTNLRDNVCKAYQLGILSGGTDKKFNPNGYLTRASAASVIHLMLDPSARPTANSTGMWTDSEFEAYMKSGAINTSCVAKIENRKIYWQDVDENIPVLLSEANNPGVNEMLYNATKCLVYHAKKTGASVHLIYDSYFEGGVVFLKYNIHRESIFPSGDIGLMVYNSPIKSPTGDEYMPMQQKSKSYYEWFIGLLYTGNYVTDQGYRQNGDRSLIDWSDPKYEVVFNDMCKAIYGEAQGNAFYLFALNTYEEICKHDIRVYQDQYVGTPSGTNFEVLYNYPNSDSNVFVSISTDKPEVRK